jgi:hypothetical protein
MAPVALTGGDMATERRKIAEEDMLYAKSKAGFQMMPRDRARALSRRGTRTITEQANDYALTYAPFIQAAVREVGHNYRQVAKWFTRERIPAQRAGRWAAQSVRNSLAWETCCKG